MRQAKLGDFLAKRSRGIVPAATPKETFELYSVPAFDGRRPEVVTGSQIGSNKQIVEPGTVLLCKINPRINRAWTVGSFTKHQKIASTEWITFPPHPEVEPKYLAHYLSRKEIRDHLAANASGVGGSLMRVKASTVEDLSIPLPGVIEQRRIVVAIEKQFSRLDDAVADLKRAKSRLNNYRDSVLTAAVQARLIRDRQRDSWPEARIGDIATVIGGLTKNPKRQGYARQLPYLRVANVYANELRLNEIEYIGVADSEVERALVHKGDMLVVEGNGSPSQIGRVALWDGSIPNCVHQNHLIKVRFNESVVPEWASFCLQSQQGRRQIESVSSSTSGLHTLSLSKIASLIIPLPSKQVQLQMVSEIERLFAFANRSLTEVNLSLSRGNALRTSMLARAFSEGSLGA